MTKFLLLALVIFIFMPSVACSEIRQLQGVILDESGKPVAGAELFLYDSLKTKRPADYISAKSGVDGRFNMKVPAAVYWGVARVRHGEKYGPLQSGDLHSGEPREIELAQEPQDLTFTVADIRELSRVKEKRQRDLSRLTGEIHDQSGQLVVSATAYVWHEPLSERLPDLMSSWTEKEGSYSLYLPPGKYAVMASTKFPPLISAGSMVTLTIGEGQKNVALNLQVIKMETDSTGTPVNSGSDGIPLDDE